MKIEKLKEGQIIKNYKELCIILEEPIKGGCAKKKQLEEFERFFDYTKEKNKKEFKINKIYKDPLPLIIKKAEGKNSKYVEPIQNILTYYLYLNRHNKNKDGKLILSFSQLINILGLANPTFLTGNCRKKELSKILQVDLVVIYYFYNNTRSEFRQIINRSLNNLKRRSVLLWGDTIVIAYNGINSNGENLIKYKKATVIEEQKILNAQKRVLEEMGLNNLFMLGSRFKEFNKKVKDILDEPLWKFYFFAYELTIGDKAVEIEVKGLKDKLEKERNNLNTKSIDRVNKVCKITSNAEMEQILLENLIDLKKYNKELDKEIKDLYNLNKSIKDKKIQENINNVIHIIEEKNKIIIDIENKNKLLQKEWENKDQIDECTYNKYKNKKNNKYKKKGLQHYSTEWGEMPSDEDNSWLELFG